MRIDVYIFSMNHNSLIIFGGLVVIVSMSHLVGYFILNVYRVLTPSLETISDDWSAVSSRPPMMTSPSSTSQLLDTGLSSERETGSVTQPGGFTLHSRQFLSDDEPASPPPQSRLPDWTWPILSTGSDGSSQEVFLQGMNTSADCRAPHPPVIRTAAENRKLQAKQRLFWGAQLWFA